MLNKIKEEQAILRKEIREKSIGYILAALGLVAGLSWNEAIKALIDQFFPSLGSGVLVKFIYAIVITVIIVIITVYLLRLTQLKDQH
jgi:ribose/xylose/arabinose/galactoside ABC-type transport system permease subunit